MDLFKAGPQTCEHHVFFDATVLDADGSGITVRSVFPEITGDLPYMFAHHGLKAYFFCVQKKLLMMDSESVPAYFANIKLIVKTCANITAADLNDIDTIDVSSCDDGALDKIQQVTGKLARNKITRRSMISPQQIDRLFKSEEFSHIGCVMSEIMAAQVDEPTRIAAFQPSVKINEMFATNHILKKHKTDIPVLLPEAFDID